MNEKTVPLRQRVLKKPKKKKDFQVPTKQRHMQTIYIYYIYSRSGSLAVAPWSEGCLTRSRLVGPQGVVRPFILVFKQHHLSGTLVNGGEISKEKLSSSRSRLAWKLLYGRPVVKQQYLVIGRLPETRIR